MTSPRRPVAQPHIVVGIEEALGLILTNLDVLTERVYLMATKAELTAALDSLKSAVTTKVQAISDQLTTLTTSFEAFRAEDTTEDAAFTARIAELQAQLAEATTLADDALAAINATTAAVEGQ